MARDTPFHELAIAFPQAALALLGLSHLTAPYRGETVRVKAEREIDVLLRPLTPGAGPRVYVELPDDPDRDVERRMLEEVLLHCTREGQREEVLAVLLYTQARYRGEARTGSWRISLPATRAPTEPRRRRRGDRHRHTTVPPERTHPTA